MVDFSNLITALNDATEQIPDAQPSIQPQERDALLAACSRLMGAVETPVEKVFRMMTAVRLPHKSFIGIEGLSVLSAASLILSLSYEWQWRCDSLMFFMEMK